MTNTQSIAGLDNCIELLQRGELTEEYLRAAFAAVAGEDAGKRQSLMYANTWDTSVFSGLVAIAIIERGERRDLSNGAAWPYSSIADAMNDGWRVIKFPDFVPDESRNYGLGCEFILEKWN